MSDAATPAANPTEAPVQPAATPATPAAPAPAAAPATQPESVTLTKEQYDQMQRDASRARTNQSKADRYDRIMKNGGSHFAQSPAAPVNPPTEEERATKAAEEDRKAERGLMALAVDPAFREVLDTDPTLRDLITQNPLAILPTMAPDALDAEDAISLVKEKLQEKADKLKAGKTPETPATPPATPATPPATPPAGGVNPPSATVPDAEYEAARKIPGTESAIQSMIKVGLKRTGGK